MSYGLKLWDATGVPILDTTDRTYTLHSVYTLATDVPANTTRFFGYPGMDASGEWNMIARGAFVYFSLTPTAGGFLLRNMSTNSVTGAGRIFDIYRG